MRDLLNPGMEEDDPFLGALKHFQTLSVSGAGSTHGGGSAHGGAASPMAIFPPASPARSHHGDSHLQQPAGDKGKAAKPSDAELAPHKKGFAHQAA